MPLAQAATAQTNTTTTFMITSRAYRRPNRAAHALIPVRYRVYHRQRAGIPAYEQCGAKITNLKKVEIFKPSTENWVMFTKRGRNR